MPIFELNHERGDCSVTGGVTYEASEIPGLEGAYVFSDYCNGDIRALARNESDGLSWETSLGVDVDNPISFGTDADGEVYVLSQNGGIFKLVAS